MTLLAAKNALPYMHDTWRIIAEYFIDENEADILVGELDLLQMTASYVISGRMCQLFSRACEGKHVATMMWLIRKHDLRQVDYCFDIARGGGYLEVCREMVKYYYNRLKLNRPSCEAICANERIFYAGKSPIAPRY